VKNIVQIEYFRIVLLFFVTVLSRFGGRRQDSNHFGTKVLTLRAAVTLSMLQKAAIMVGREIRLELV